MAREKKKCRVCGKPYTACRTVNPVPGAYNWREVACSPECAMEYVRRVTEAREKGKPLAEASTVAQSAPDAEAEDEGRSTFCVLGEQDVEVFDQ